MSSRTVTYIACCAILLVLIWSQVSFVFLQAAQTLHYHKVRSERNEENKFRDTLIVSSEEYKKISWVKDDEIRFAGRMFDVKKVLIQERGVMIVGHYDAKDDSLFSAINSLFESDHDVGSHTKRYSILAIEAIMEASLFESISRYPLVLKVNEEWLPALYIYSLPDTTFQPPELS